MKEEIIKMAQEAGLHIATDVNWMPIIGYEYLERFFHMAQAAEREACAKLCEQDENQADDWVPDSRPGGHFAAAIRARGQA